MHELIQSFWGNNMRSFNPFFDVSVGEKLTFMERVRKAFWVLNGKNDVQIRSESQQHVGLLEYILFPLSIVQLSIKGLEKTADGLAALSNNVENTDKALSLDRVFIYAGRALITPLALVTVLIVSPILEILRNIVAGVLTLVALPFILSVHLWPEKKASEDKVLVKEVGGRDETREMQRLFRGDESVMSAGPAFRNRNAGFTSSSSSSSKRNSIKSVEAENELDDVNTNPASLRRRG
jgi:hypothetical protein